MSRQLEARLAEEGLSIEQWRILNLLSDGNGRSLSEIAEVARLYEPTLTKIIDYMESNALLYRARDLRDRRAVLMFCSDRGRILCRRLK
jgi:DNA-binding MarR family transcriptional regulator